MENVKSGTIKLCFYCKKVVGKSAGTCPHCGRDSSNTMSCYVTYTKTKRWFRRPVISVISCSSRYLKKYIPEIEAGRITIE